MNEFLHGPASKSGGVKKLNTMTKKLSTKMQRSTTHNAVRTDSSKEHNEPVRRRSTMKQAIPTGLTLSATLRKKKSSKNLKDGYESSESEGTKALNEQYE